MSLRDVIYTPAQSANVSIATVDMMSKNLDRAVIFPVKLVNDYFAPLPPASLTSVIAQTSNGKSMMMRFWAKFLANQLMRESRDEVIIYVSLEDTVEEQLYGDLATVSHENAGDISRGLVKNWDALKLAAVEVGSVPIYRIGESVSRQGADVDLHVRNIAGAIDAIASGKVTGEPVTIAAIFVDYLQAMPFDPNTGRKERRLAVKSDVYALRRMGRKYICPVIQGVQAKQTLPGATDTWKVPGIYDGEESSSIGQRSDRIVQLWMPKMDLSPGEVMERSGFSTIVEENYMVIKVGKQRGNLPAGQWWLCEIDWRTGAITPMNIDHVDLAEVE